VFGLFKRRVTANDLAVTLARLAMDTTNIEKAVVDLHAGGEFSMDAVMDESLFLQLFAVDYAAAVTLGVKSKEKNSLLDAYYGHILQMTNKMDAMEEDAGKGFLDKFKHRLLIYTKAVKIQHRNGPSWNVGKEFARLCNAEKNFDIIMFGNFLFSASVKLATETIMSCHIVM